MLEKSSRLEEVGRGLKCLIKAFILATNSVNIRSEEIISEEINERNSKKVNR